MVLLSSFRNKIPFIGLSKSWVKAGALYSLEWDYPDIGKQCAVVASQILNGKNVYDIPARKMSGNATYSLNTRTVRHMKLDIGSEIIDGASFVFK